jgi:PiT family inorganic phosphate transporter
VNYALLGNTFITPLLLSHLIAVAVGATVYLVLRGFRIATGIQTESCVCVGNEWVPVAVSNGAACAEIAFTLTVDSPFACEQGYQGSILGFQAKGMIDKLHFHSAGAVSFARGLNDRPKIAVLLLVTGPWSSQWYLVITAFSIALGGLLNARRVADTMSHKLTEMNPGEGLAANLSSALLVTTANLHGLPVSTTHVTHIPHHDGPDYFLYANCSQ